MELTVLVVDDDRAVAEFCRRILVKSGYSVLVAGSGQQALEAVEAQAIDIVISDLKMPGIDGVELLKKIAAVDGAPEVVLMTGYGTVASAVEAVKLGAHDYLEKPLTPARLEATVQRLAEVRRLRSENMRLRIQLSSERGERPMIGNSAAMLAVYESIQRVASRDQPVLVRGETGTGKELVARAIHQHGRRRDKPFVAVDCAALSDNVIESDLFGHVKGSFTGSVGDRPGLLATAADGTLFLDEIGELPVGLQAKLFRVLQDREYRPVGSDTVRHFSGCVIAATNRDLERALQTGTFRQELYYRLRVHEIQVPPLRYRKSDIPLLVQHFVEAHGEGRVLAVTREAMGTLENYDWPGNIRQLENCLMSMIAGCTGRVIESKDVPRELRHAVEQPAAETSLDAAERETIAAMLRDVDGNVGQAAVRLGVSRATLYRKMGNHGLTRKSRVNRRPGD